MSYPAYPNHTSRCSSTKSISSKGTPVDNMIHNSHRERMDKEKMKVIRMLIVVVVLFVVCWGPILINNLLVAFDVLDKLHVGPLKPLRMAMSLLSYLNSSLNPLVYGFMSRHFRRGFRDAIRVCCSRPARRGVESRLHRVTRSNNMSCYYASDFRTSTVRTGTVRLSPVTEQIKVGDEEELDVSPVGSLRYGRKIWARTERVPHNVEDI